MRRRLHSASQCPPNRESFTSRISRFWRILSSNSNERRWLAACWPNRWLPFVQLMTVVQAFIPPAMPASRARPSQCRGCGMRTPARIVVAYGSEIPSSAEISATETFPSFGRIAFEYVFLLNHMGRSCGFHERFPASCLRIVSARSASAIGEWVAILPSFAISVSAMLAFSLAHDSQCSWREEISVPHPAQFVCVRDSNFKG